MAWGAAAASPSSAACYWQGNVLHFLRTPPPTPTPHTHTHHPHPCPFPAQISTDDHKRQSFHIIRHVRINHFNSGLGLMGISVLWKVAAYPGNGLAISDVVTKVLQVGGGRRMQCNPPPTHFALDCAMHLFS
jgi:hypothetical protein